MKVIAFFDLKEKTDPEEFLAWTRNEQARVFEKEIQGMKNFKVYITSDYDGMIQIPKMVQIFDYDGTSDDWRKILKDFRKTRNKEISKIVKEWLEFCEDESTKILYIDDMP
jgi:hypothetical protein